MATKEQIDAFFEDFRGSYPEEFMKKVNETQAGVGAILRLLDLRDGMVTAGEISEEMDVSTARVAALLKKMEARDLITRTKSPLDARVTIVQLTEKGDKINKMMHANLEKQISQLIDRIGEERLKDYFAISKEINEALRPPKMNL